MRAWLLPKFITLLLPPPCRAITKYQSPMEITRIITNGKNSIYHGVTSGARYCTVKLKSVTADIIQRLACLGGGNLTHGIDKIATDGGLKNHSSVPENPLRQW